MAALKYVKAFLAAIYKHVKCKEFNVIPDL